MRPSSITTSASARAAPVPSKTRPPWNTVLRHPVPSSAAAGLDSGRTLPAGAAPWTCVCRPPTVTCRSKARASPTQVLIPLEDECEENDGLTPESHAAAKQAVLDWRLQRDQPRRRGRRPGARPVPADARRGAVGPRDRRAVGHPVAPVDPARRAAPRRRRSGTCARRAAASGATRTRSPRRAPAPTRRWSRPPRGATATAGCSTARSGTSRRGDVADFFLAPRARRRRPGEGDRVPRRQGPPGVRLVRTPKYMHTFVFEHPIFAFEDVRVGDEQRARRGRRRATSSRRTGSSRSGIMIGARTMGAVGARARPLARVREGTRGSSARRSSSSRRSSSCSPTWPPRSWPRSRCCTASCWEAARGGASRKELHAMASAVKLVCSETAGRVIDKAVQIHGGRGYMREQPVERLYRELRVDRIWEGTSEIQRVVIGNELRKRGADAVHGLARGGVASPRRERTTEGAPDVDARRRTTVPRPGRAALGRRAGADQQGRRTGAPRPRARARRVRASRRGRRRAARPQEALVEVLGLASRPTCDEGPEDPQTPVG